ncbi:MAG: enoyl-CoA hydratase [Desulfobacteraceae bacterium]|nr:enoyl-CoA hydratase [Desulfobacteraceae bacterium]MBC2755456.1 enoyl-CoA hydratase [Desulfobacteraceae bacterium]
MEHPVLFSIENQTAIITLNRPERRNSINQALLAGLYDSIEQVSKDDNIRVAILTGNGKSFCSGIDLDAVLVENLFDPRGDGADLPDVVRACEKPIIGAINGHAITGGLEIALNCDFLIASENATFADTHAKVGIHPGWGMTQLLQQAIGRLRARQMSFTCQFISAQTACGWGLVNEVVAPDMLLDRAKEIAAQICMVNQDLLAVVKKLIDYRGTTTLDDAFTHERQGFRAFVKKHLNT